MPGTIGWGHSLGSVLLFLFLLQLGTGTVLALYYVPVPDYAWQSRAFLTDETVIGRTLVSIHHWGSSLMVVVAVLHLLRVVLHGAYRAPRELNWITGILLLLMILAFAVTGFLLPWNQQGYWSTVVGRELSESIPIIGSGIAYIIMGGEQVGAPTLTRFYALHVIVFPLTALLLGGLHLYLLRTHGSAPPPPIRKTEGQPDLPFFPYQTSRDAVAILATFFILLFLALASPYGGEPPADPLDSSYDPRPEWFLLAQYELLRIAGSYVFLIAILIPAIILIVISFIPFFDRASGSWHWRTRKRVVVPVFVLVLLLTGITIWSRIYHPGVYGEMIDVEPEQLLLPHAENPQLEQRLLEGRQVFVEEQCINCHRVGELGGSSGPRLTAVTETRSPDFIRAKIVDPRREHPLSPMPAYRNLDPARLETVVEYVWRLQGMVASETETNEARRVD
ncbi:MAG TPA: cytochrome b N-terminal domain-containing protein [Acidobacteriota bacterium]|nr:cytochrome b N-terminal domain-containing protein [Acidobacteriota bacterium]